MHGGLRVSLIHVSACVRGVALVPAVGACGMWKEEEDGGRVWITCLDTLQKKTHP